MTWGAVAIAGGSFLASRQAGKSAERAAGTAADAQIAAAEIAAEEARFRPVGITTRFGQSTFGFDEAGRLKDAGYTLDPELVKLQSRLLGVTPETLTAALNAGAEVAPVRDAATGLFGLGQQFLPTSAQAGASPEAQAYAAQLRQYGQQFLPGQLSREASPEAMAQAQGLFNLQQQVTPTSYDPNAAAQSYFNEAQMMLDPARQRQEQRLGASVFGRGRAGLNISGQGQPELFALGQAREEQNMALAAQARERARQELQQDIGFGTGLGMQGLATQQQAQELARQRGFQDVGFGLDLAGRGLGAAESATDLARQRLSQDIGLGTGLFGTGMGLLGQIPTYQTAALGPLQSQLGLASTIEQLGQQPLDIGAQLGGRAATAGAQAGEALLRGGLGAAQTQLGGQQAALGMRYGAIQDVLGQLNRPSGLFGGGSGGMTYNQMAAIQNMGGSVGLGGYSYYG
jgi:hypothetical protein